jgi:hypothetical protein
VAKHEAELLAAMRAGKRLVWFGDCGPELEGCSCWPSKRTVRALLNRGILRWGEPLNKTQQECGICPVELVERM